MNQGKKANETGKRLEDVIFCTLQRAGYVVSRQVCFCKSIYGSPWYVDFVVRNVPGYPDGLAIEAKYQKARGTNDHKLVYLVTNIRERFPMPAMVILEGPGFSEGAKRWIRSQVGGKLQAVMSIEEFLIWLAELSDQDSTQIDLFAAQVVTA